MIKRLFVASMIVLTASASFGASIDYTLTQEPVVIQQRNDNATAAKSVSVAPLVTGIYIKGLVTVKQDAVVDQVNTKIGEMLSEEKIKNDQKSIFAMGSFSDVSVSFEKSKAGTNVIFKVKENPLIAGITLEGISVFSREAVLSHMKSKTGQLLSYANVQSDLKTIEELFRSNGFVLAKVVDISTDPVTNVIRIKVVEGQIESVLISGNTNTKDYVIQREINSRAGDVFNEKVLAKDLRRVFNLGFFSEINPDFEPSLSGDKVILVIRVKESKTNTINFGGGYGEREGWFGFVDLSADNLMGSGQGMLLRGQAGQQQQTYQFRYMYPWFMPNIFGDRTSMTFRRWLTIGKNIYLLETAEREGVYNGWDVSLNRPINDEWSLGLSLGSEKVTPSGTATFEEYQANTIGISAAYDTRDNLQNPSTGQFYSYGLRKGWKIASSDTNFTKHTIDLNQFIKTYERQTLAIHLGLGAGFGDIPVGEIYYAGGTNTIRGYEPIEARTGIRKIVANIEYRYSFNDMFQGVVFFDWGNAWNEGWPDPFKFISGKGFGLRLNTPMGPIRLDYGIGSNRAFAEGVLHFSIGQAF